MTFTGTVYLNSNRRAIHPWYCSQIQSLWERNYVRHGLELSSNPNLLSCLYNGDRSRSAQNVAAGYTASASSVCFVSSALYTQKPGAILARQAIFHPEFIFSACFLTVFALSACAIACINITAHLRRNPIHWRPQQCGHPNILHTAVGMISAALASVEAIAR